MIIQLWIMKPIGNISLIIWIQAIHKIILNSNSIYKENNNGTPVFTLLSASHWALGFSFVRFTWHVHYSLLQLIPLPHYFVLLVAAVATKRFLSQIFFFQILCFVLEKLFIFVAVLFHSRFKCSLFRYNFLVPGKII